MSQFDRPAPPAPDELRAVVATAKSFTVRFGQGGGITSTTRTLTEARAAVAPFA